MITCFNDASRRRAWRILNNLKSLRRYVVRADAVVELCWHRLVTSNRSSEAWFVAAIALEAGSQVDLVCHLVDPLNALCNQIVDVARALYAVAVDQQISTGSLLDHVYV